MLVPSPGFLTVQKKDFQPEYDAEEENYDDNDDDNDDDDDDDMVNNDNKYKTNKDKHQKVDHNRNFF